MLLECTVLQKARDDFEHLFRGGEEVSTVMQNEDHEMQNDDHESLVGFFPEGGTIHQDYRRQHQLIQYKQLAMGKGEHIGTNGMHKEYVELKWF